MVARNAWLRMVIVGAVLWQLSGPVATLLQLDNDHHHNPQTTPTTATTIQEQQHQHQQQNHAMSLLLDAPQAAKPRQRAVASNATTTTTRVLPANTTDSIIRSTSSTAKDASPTATTTTNQTATTTTTTTPQSQSQFDATTLSSIRRRCFPYNSDSWIQSDIFSNNDEGVTEPLVDTLISGPADPEKLSFLLDRTICHPNSPLRDFELRQQPLGGIDELDRLSSVEDWYHRLLYLALHWRFHEPALAEHAARTQCSFDERSQFMRAHSIRSLDYECPDQKFLVIPMGNIGFGAFLNTRATLGILLALKTNRIPVFAQQQQKQQQQQQQQPPSKRRDDRAKWLLAPDHCERQDLQCYFLATSPCTITQNELFAAKTYGTNTRERSYLGTHLAIPPELSRERVLIVNSGLTEKARDTPQLRSMAAEVTNRLLNEWKAKFAANHTTNLDLPWDVLEEAQHWITSKAEADPTGLLRQAYVYLLRPLPSYHQQVEAQVLALVPPSTENPSQTIGIAIRGSDKCKAESSCLEFETYMDLATTMALPALLPLHRNNGAGGDETDETTDTNRPRLVLTTEDPDVFNQSLAYQSDHTFPYEFIVNPSDNLQGSGYPKEFSGQAEATMVSSLVALKMHFSASIVYLNCCSNFHVVLGKLLEGQCGATKHGHAFVDYETTQEGGTTRINGTTDNELLPAKRRSQPLPPVARCLSDRATPEPYRICCLWSKKDPSCREWKRENQQRKQQRRNTKKNRRTNHTDNKRRSN